MTIFQGIFDSSSVQTISVQAFILCVLTGLATGILLYVLTNRKQKYNASFAICIMLLPAAVCVVIMMVNGNLGASLSVAGAFSLIRFRSSQGNAWQMITVLIAMAAGLITGMGYLAFAFLFTLMMAMAMDLFALIIMKSATNKERLLYITIPESLQYGEKMEEVISFYTQQYELEQVRTSNMGSLFKLMYRVQLKKDAVEKEMIDELRQYNGNLEIHMARCDAQEISGM